MDTEGLEEGEVVQEQERHLWEPRQIGRKELKCLKSVVNGFPEIICSNTISHDLSLTFSYYSDF